MFGGIESLAGAELVAVLCSRGLVDGLVEDLELRKSVWRELLSGTELGGFILHAAFDFADAFEVLLQLVLVLFSEGALKALGVVEDDIEDRLIGGSAGFAILVPVAEESIKGDARIDLAGEGDVGFFPGNVGAVESGQVDVAIDSTGDGLGAELHGGKSGASADDFGGDLVDGDSVGADVGALGGFNGGAGEPTGGFVIVSVAFFGRRVGKAADDGDIVLYRFERGKDG